MVATIGMDLGGTRIKAVLMDSGGRILEKAYTSTNDDKNAGWKSAVSNSVNGLLKNKNYESVVIGIAAPGLPDDTQTLIAYMPGRMQGLEHFAWKDYLRHPAYVLNDAVAALIAESKLGVAKDKNNVVMLTLGTGVGGAILLDGKPYMGAFNKAGHIGHMVINDEGECDITGMPGSLEDCIGECTIKKRSKNKFTSTLELLEALRSGDNYAKEIWLTSVKKLAIGLASLTNILSPELIVLGGGITEANEDLFDPLNEYMNRYEWRTGGNKATIVKAKLGDLAGAIGAACFAIEKYHSNTINT
jgi:glucokinase